MRAINLLSGLFWFLFTGLLPCATAQLALAQTADSDAPVLIHRPAGSAGTAGALQTFVARVADQSALKHVVLYYRQGSSGTFSGIPMRLLYDSADEYMIAIESKSLVAGSEIQYFIYAEDDFGNTISQGDQRAPLVLSLVAPSARELQLMRSTPLTTPVQPRSPEAVNSRPAPPRENRSAGWILGALALVALGALAAGGGGDSPDEDTVILTIISPTPNN